MIDSERSKKSNDHIGKIPTLFHYLPGWKGNLFLFVLLICCSLIYFYFQMFLVNKSFQKHSHEIAMVVSSVVRLNIERTMLSLQGVEEVMEIFLGNSADFVGYLDALEPFSDIELTAFVEEAGLAGIRLVRGNGEIVDGPSNWLPEKTLCQKSGMGLQHFEKQHIYSLIVPPVSVPGDKNGCIIIGLHATRIEQLRERTGVEQLLSSLTRLPGIVSVEILPGQFPENKYIKPDVRLVLKENRSVAETRLLVGDNTLVIGFDARRFAKRVKLLRFEFVLFISVLIILGSFFSWLLYRYQAAEKKRTRDFERQLAHQNEEAALGRTTATIAHEVRNPLNAISIGLQRLQLEANELPEEHKKLLHSMDTAVQRTNRIITDLQKYSRPVEFVEQDIDISEIIQSVLTLYDQQCREQDIKISDNINSDVQVRGDKELLGQVCENLVKNAVEAQQNGGFIDVGLQRDQGKVYLTIENGGLTLSSEEFGKITEPYFTTKAKGCGLGLAVSKKIVEAHKGSIDIEADQGKATFRVIIQLPEFTV